MRCAALSIKRSSSASGSWTKTAESELAAPARLLIEAQVAWAESFGLGTDAKTKKDDAEASSENASTREDRLEPVEEALGSSKRSLVHLLQVYSNPAPWVVAPQELLFRSTRSIRTDESPPRPRRARQLRADETEQLIAHYLAVRNIRTVAKDFRMSRTTVARILTEHGVSTSRGMTDAQVAAAVDLYVQGLSSATIGKRLGFDNHTILKNLWPDPNYSVHKL